MPLILPADTAGIGEATRLLRSGEIVAVPTETVYGLAADATDGAAVARIYAAKGRPGFNPLIVHASTIEQARQVARFDPLAEQLAAAFWPGPLTMVLPLADGSPVASLVTAGLPTVAVRLPAHPAMRALIAATGRPLAAPSANASGRLSPTTAAHVAASLGEAVPLILDGGATAHGLESTVVGVAGDIVHLLRPGPVTAEALASVTGAVPAAAGPGIVSPGQLEAHYAPTRPLRLDVSHAEPHEWLIGFGTAVGHVNLSPGGDLVEAAARLFDLLHEADRSGAAGIAIAPIPAQGLGMAIRDRLSRAAKGAR